jgi:hypothetical protein
VLSLQAELAMVRAANRQAAAAAAALVQQHHHQHLQQQLIIQQTTGAAGVMQLQQLQEAAHQPTHENIMSPAHLPNISIISGSSTTAGQGNTIMYANRSSIKEENINMQQQQQQQQQAHQVQQQQYVTELAAGMSNPSSSSHGQLRSLMNTDQSNFHKFQIPPRHRDPRDHQQLQQHDPAPIQLHERHHHRHQITSHHQGRSAGAAAPGADHQLMMSHETFASLLPRK